MTPAIPAPAPSPAKDVAGKERRKKNRRKRDWVGSTIGLIVFLGGVALLVLVFRLAYDMFQTPPMVALQIEGGKAVELGRASERAIAILVKVVVLLIMAVAGSLVANRGILMYSRSSYR